MLKCQIVKTGNKNTNSLYSNILFLQYCFIEQIPRRPHNQNHQTISLHKNTIPRFREAFGNYNAFFR